MVNAMHKELEALRDWIGFYVDTDATPSQQTIKGIYDKLDALLRDGGCDWLPIQTIPTDGSRVELLSANGKTDVGNWYRLSVHSDDIQDHLNTDNGEGSYTHWRALTGDSR